MEDASFTVEQRAIAALNGVAVGDAMGKMTEGYWPQEVISVYGGRLTEFMEPVQPKSRFKWRRAEVTDDTAFTILVAESIVKMKCVNREDIITRILDHKDGIKGWPRWKKFRYVVGKGHEEQIRFALEGTGNGAPMRVSPIGIINKPEKIEKIVKDVELACAMTHGVRSALCGACAMAAAISAAIEGWSKREVLSFAVKAAKMGESLGFNDERPVADRILTGMNFIDGYNGANLATVLRRVLNPGFEAYEAVPYALSLIYGIQGAKDAILEAVNQGGDADSIASMAGSVAAALDPKTLPKDWVDEVKKANNLQLTEMALNLLKLRK